MTHFNDGDDADVAGRAKMGPGQIDVMAVEGKTPAKNGVFEIAHVEKVVSVGWPVREKFGNQPIYTRESICVKSESKSESMHRSILGGNKHTSKERYHIYAPTLTAYSARRWL